jgi:hypothetical protein
MNDYEMASSSNAVRLGRVCVIPYKRPTWSAKKFEAFAEILAQWRFAMFEVGSEATHLRWLAGIHRAPLFPLWIDSLQFASSRGMHHQFPGHLVKFQKTPYFWHHADYVGSTETASWDRDKRSVNAQESTNQEPRNSAKHQYFFPGFSECIQCTGTRFEQESSS